MSITSSAIGVLADWQLTSVAARLAEIRPAKNEPIKARFALELKANGRASHIDDRGPHASVICGGGA
jgi:hypothetical protein